MGPKLRIRLLAGYALVLSDAIDFLNVNVSYLINNRLVLLLLFSYLPPIRGPSIAISLLY